MIIQRDFVGSGKNRRFVYVVCNSAAELGESKPRELVRFDDLETAVLVMRYIQCENLSALDEIAARNALKKATA